MTITTNKKNLIRQCSKGFHDLFHPYPMSWNSLWQYSSTDQGLRATLNWRSYWAEKHQLVTADDSFASELRSRKRAAKDGRRQKRANKYKSNNVSSRQYPMASRQYPMSYQQYPISYQQYPTTPQQHPISYQQYPTTPQQHPISYQQYPTTPQQHPISYQQYPIVLRQNAISCQQYPTVPRQNASSTELCPTEVRLFNPEVQFPGASGRQIDADYHLTGSHDCEMFYQCKQKTIEEAMATSVRGPVHTINLIFNHKTQ